MVPSGQRPHPAGRPLQAQAPNSHAHMLGLSVHLLLSEPWPAWEVEADDRGSHTHCSPLWARTDPLPPAAGWRAKRPGIEQRFTMEGRGCRREVPGLTLVLFSGQMKASSCFAVAMPERPAGQPGRVSAAWGAPAVGAAWEPGPIHKGLQEST